MDKEKTIQQILELHGRFFEELEELLNRQLMEYQKLGTDPIVVVISQLGALSDSVAGHLFSSIGAQKKMGLPAPDVRLALERWVTETRDNLEQLISSCPEPT